MLNARLEKRPLTRGEKTVWRIRQHGGFYLLLVPSLILLIVFTYVPMYGVVIAFKNFKPIDGIWAVSYTHLSIWRMPTIWRMLSPLAESTTVY